MNQMAQFNNPEQQTMSSREIADLTGKRHDNVLQLVRKLHADQILSPEFQETPFNGRLLPFALLNKRDSLVLVARLSPEFTARIVDRWQELETQQKPALPNFTNPAEAARAWAKEFEQKQAALEQLEAAKPAVEFVGRYVEATGNKGFRQVAKLLKANERELRQFLSDHKILYKLGGEWVPYQTHIDAGRFVVKTGVADNEHAYNTAKFTPKGINWLAEKWNLHSQEAA